MKRPILKKEVDGSGLKFSLSWKRILPLTFSLLLASLVQISAAQSPIPTVAVQFANPTIDCPTKTYCLEVQFKTDTPGEELFYMNVRFFYEDDILEFESFGDFQGGYHSVGVPIIDDSNDSSLGDYLGFPGSNMDFVNGIVELQETPDHIYLTDTWTTLFKICFHVDDPGPWKIEGLCPAVIWDLQEGPQFPGDPNTGYLEGDDGLVMTVARPNNESLETTEQPFSLNWIYSGTPMEPPVGNYVRIICVDCPPVIPVSNWALFLGIGLMLVLTVFIYRRRISG